MSSRRPSPPAWKQRSTRLNTRIDPLSDCRRTGASTQSGNDLQRGDAGKKAISDSPGDDEARESRDLQSREVVTATWAPLTGHRLATVIYPADVRSYGTTQPMRIARSVLVYVFEVVQFLRLDPPGGESVSGESTSGTPFLQRPQIFAARNSGSILSLFLCRKLSNQTTSCCIILSSVAAVLSALR